MKGSFLLSNSKKYFLVLSTVLYFIAIIYLLKFNPDPHHDGILFSAGSATSNGLVPQLDYLFIWGPLFPYLLSIPFITWNSLLSLRIFGYIIICITAFLIYRVNNRNLPRHISAMLSVTWLASYPAISIYSSNIWPTAMTSWPNMYGFMMILISILILLNQKKSNEKYIFLPFIAGTFAVASIFIRFNFIALYFGLFVFVALKYKYSKATILFVLPALIISLVFYLNRKSDFIEAWVTQTFTALKSGGYNTGIPSVSLLGLTRAFASIFLLAAIYSVLLCLVQNITKRKLIISLVLSMITAIYILISKIENKTFSLGKLDPWIDKINSEFSLGYVAVSLLCLIPLTYWGYKQRDFDIESNPNQVLLCILAFVTLPLNHNLNIDYIWLNSIFLVSYAVPLLLKFTKLNYLSFFIPSLIFSLAVLVFGVINMNAKNVYQFTNPPLIGMKSVDFKAGQDLDAELKLINAIPNNSQFQNLCENSIYALGEKHFKYPSNALSYSDVSIFSTRMKPKSDAWIFKCSISTIDYVNAKNKMNFSGVKLNSGLYSVVYKEN